MHPIYTMSFADREMFAHNKRVAESKAKLERVLAQPENRIKYCFEFLKSYISDGDQEMTKKCYDGIAKYSDKLDWSEAHY